jgi:UDP-N-acetylmuramoylalanine--D-glutamate ligase
MAEAHGTGLPDLRGALVVVCGARFAGQAATRALLALGADVRVVDAAEPDGLAELIAAGARFLGPVEQLPAGTALVVTSPGWRPTHPLLAEAAAQGVPVLGEVEFAWRLRGPDAARWLVLTGTNGKTTTVRMLESMLRAGGLRALAVGNVGVSVIDAVRDAGAWDVLAVEASSYQLYWSATLRPVAGALLNLAADHLDWHGTMAHYEQAKARVWQAGTAIGNADDARVADLLDAVDGPTVRFTLGLPVDGEVGVVDGRLVSNAFGDDGAVLAAVDEVRPPGDHNVANALAAAALARAAGVSPAAIGEGLRAFVPDPHRNQAVLERDGIRWVDDSKATNPHAALASLTAYPSVVWIAGGQLKGVDPDELVAQVASRLRAVVLLGVDRALIATALARHAPGLPVIEVANTDDGAMTEVVRAAARLARPGDTVLLAPAAASYDMFSGYGARGDAFADAARAAGPGRS